MTSSAAAAAAANAAAGGAGAGAGRPTMTKKNGLGAPASDIITITSGNFKETVELNTQRKQALFGSFFSPINECIQCIPQLYRCLLSVLPL